jgi:hypothetical protein
MKKNKEINKVERHILYELLNHEAFFTMDIEDSLNSLKKHYTPEQVQEVFDKYVDSYSF